MSPESLPTTCCRQYRNCRSSPSPPPRPDYCRSRQRFGTTAVRVRERSQRSVQSCLTRRLPRAEMSCACVPPWHIDVGTSTIPGPTLSPPYLPLPHPPPQPPPPHSHP